jgi:hypothetical protein
VKLKSIFKVMLKFENLDLYISRNYSSVCQQSVRCTSKISIQEAYDKAMGFIPTAAQISPFGLKSTQFQATKPHTAGILGHYRERI